MFIMNHWLRTIVMRKGCQNCREKGTFSGMCFQKTKERHEFSKHRVQEYNLRGVEQKTRLIKHRTRGYRRVQDRKLPLSTQAPWKVERATAMLKNRE